jgi:hypothetical protein
MPCIEARDGANSLRPCGREFVAPAYDENLGPAAVIGARK